MITLKIKKLLEAVDEIENDGTQPAPTDETTNLTQNVSTQYSAPKRSANLDILKTLCITPRGCTGKVPWVKIRCGRW